MKMRKFIVGLDLGGTNIKIGLVNQQGRILRKKALATTNFRDKNQLIAAFVNLVKQFILEEKLRKNNILGLGMGLPGPIDSKRGIVHFFPNIPGWNNVPLKRIMENRLNLPTFVDNDVNLITLAEWKYGAGRGVNNMVCLTLGTGVGGGIIIEGRLYRGSSLTAGEIGHIPINEDGPLCNCGGRGCLERYVGNRYILQYARKRLKNKRLTLEELTRLAKNGNHIAIDIWQITGRRIGVALAGLVNVLNPSRIVIGGGISDAGRVLFSEVSRTLKRRAMPQQAKCVKVLKAKLGSDAGIIGALILVKDKLDL